ncbi:MAG TPA: R3H domain-containing nucleic acid-binding protein [Acidobacteriaceae bacterium]|nr:R3H domain-containing nucleic acid-binding protein [Acidobacteriaceae bacterium]
MRLRYRVKARGAAPEEGAEPAAGSHMLAVEFIGPDTRWLTARNGELLNALEHIATKILRLEPEAHDQVSFDADQFKANRDRQLRNMADEAVESVKESGRPFAFPPMSSRERRMLHMLLVDSGLQTASSGEGPGRYVVLYPAEGDTRSAEAHEQNTRARHANIRERFRPRS